MANVSQHRPADPLDVQRIREDFPILSRTVNGKSLVYLDNAATSQKPRAVIQTLVDYYERHNSNVHRGVHTLSMEATEMYEEARSKVANFIHAPSPEQIVWTRNTTEAINLVAQSWAVAKLKPKDEVLLTELEHHSNLVPWQQVAARTGAVLRFIPLAEDFTLDLSNLDRLLNRKTRLVAFSMMSNVLGSITPAKQIVGGGASGRGYRPPRRCPGCAAPAHRRARAGLRLHGLLGSQDVRADGHWGAVCQPSGTGGDGALPYGRRDGEGGVAG